MFSIKILEKDDIITSDCFFRPLVHSYPSRASDSIYFTSEYSGAPINRMTWTEIQRIAPAFIGKKVKSYIKRVEPGLFCIGELPTFLITPLTESEFHEEYRKYLSTLYVPFVKKTELKGKSALEIKQIDPEYFDWLRTKTNAIESELVRYQNYLNSRK
jgi:hypothetical protein